MFKILSDIIFLYSISQRYPWTIAAAVRLLCNVMISLFSDNASFLEMFLITYRGDFHCKAFCTSLLLLVFLDSVVA